MARMSKAEARERTLYRKSVRRNKYAVMDLSADLLARVNHA